MGRNQPCWCGSGVKFKKCHLLKETMEPLKPWELQKKLSEALSRKCCLHPLANKGKCKGPIIRAHTIQKAGVLSKIAYLGHVYMRVNNNEEVPGQPIVKKIGINQASTFNGFCAYHDNKIFQEIENSPFLASPLQIFLYGYRALCRDVFTKRVGKEFIQTGLPNIDQGRESWLQQEMQEWVQAHEHSHDLALRELEKEKDLYDTALLKKDFTKMNFYVLETLSAPEVSSSINFIPEYDFQGKSLQDLSKIDQPVESIKFSIFSTEKGGAIIFCWLSEFNGTCRLFLESLEEIPDKNKPDAVIRCAFEYGENTFFSIKWWESLNEDAQSKLLRRLLSGIENDYRNPKCLVDFEGPLVDWDISSKKTSL